MVKKRGTRNFPDSALAKLVELRIDMGDRLAATTNTSVRGKNKRMGVKAQVLWKELAAEMQEYFRASGEESIPRSQLEWGFLKRKWKGVEDALRVRRRIPRPMSLRTHPRTAAPRSISRNTFYPALEQRNSLVR